MYLLPLRPSEIQTRFVLLYRHDNILYFTHYIIIVVTTTAAVDASAVVFGNDHYYNIYKTDYYVTFTVNGRALVLLLCGAARA